MPSSEGRHEQREGFRGCLFLFCFYGSKVRTFLFFPSLFREPVASSSRLPFPIPSQTTSAIVPNPPQQNPVWYHGTFGFRDRKITPSRVRRAALDHTRTHPPRKGWRERAASPATFECTLYVAATAVSAFVSAAFRPYSSSSSASSSWGSWPRSGEGSLLWSGCKVRMA